MNLWLVTSIRLTSRRQQPLASSLQNVLTAMALAELGHGVLLWLAELEEGGEEALAERLGRPVPDGLRLMAYNPRGPKEEKKTPFDNPLAGLINILRARARFPRPDAVLTRSPRIINQLRNCAFMSRASQCLLEYQYPEWALLWRGWRRRHPRAGLRECLERLRVWRHHEEQSLRLADGILYAALDHRLLLERAAYAGRTAWLPSGCLPPDAAPAQETAASYELGYVGSLTPENGLECLLEGLARLESGRVLLVGHGRPAYLEFLQRRVRELDLTNRVDFAGAVEFKDVRSMMRRCRIGLVPISGREGPEKRQYASPLKLIEWMAAGVPVIATSVPSVRQFAVHGKEAWLIPPQSPQALAEAIAELQVHAYLRKSLIAGGRLAAQQAAYPQRAARIVKFIESA